MIQYYAPEIISNPILPEGESQHAVRVLRLKTGDDIRVTDGKGNIFRCRIADAHAKHTMVEILESEKIIQPWRSNITIGVAPTKHLDRIEWMVEKMVEIGVNRIVPLLCRHSERKELKIERINRIVLSAMNQSLKAEVPMVDEMMPITKLIDSLSPDSQRFVGYCDDEIERKLLSRTLQPDMETVILIGPEGDFTIEEINRLYDSKFQPVTFGDVRLRTETAAITALQTFHVINQLA